MKGVIFIFDSIFNLIFDIVNSFVVFVDGLYYQIFPDGLGYFDNLTFNIYLFSETGWFSEPLYISDVFVLTAGIFIFIFLIRLLWKATKKFINFVFGVFKL